MTDSFPFRSRGAAAAIRFIAISVGVGGTVFWGHPLVANAHDELIATRPQANANARQVTAVELTFSEKLLPTGSTVIVTGSSGQVSQKLTLTGRKLTSSFAQNLATGQYRVQWRAVSSDGHPISGEFQFTVSPPGGNEPTATPTIDATSAETPIPQETENSSPATTTTGGVPGWVTMAGVAGGLVGVSLAIRRRNRDTPS
ncbi:MAG: copper resistance CopC family protein [Actinomycetota bacterium]